MKRICLILYLLIKISQIKSFKVLRDKEDVLVNPHHPCSIYQASTQNGSCYCRKKTTFMSKNKEAYGCIDDATIGCISTTNQSVIHLIENNHIKIPLTCNSSEINATQIWNFENKNIFDVNGDFQDHTGITKRFFRITPDNKMSFENVDLNQWSGHLIKIIYWNNCDGMSPRKKCIAIKFKGMINYPIDVQKLKFKQSSAAISTKTFINTTTTAVPTHTTILASLSITTSWLATPVTRSNSSISTTSAKSLTFINNSITVPIHKKNLATLSVARTASSVTSNNRTMPNITKNEKRTTIKVILIVYEIIVNTINISLIHSRQLLFILRAILLVALLIFGLIIIALSRFCLSWKHRYKKREAQMVKRRRRKTFSSESIIRNMNDIIFSNSFSFNGRLSIDNESTRNQLYRTHTFIQGLTNISVSESVSESTERIYEVIPSPFNTPVINRDENVNAGNTVSFAASYINTEDVAAFSTKL